MPLRRRRRRALQAHGCVTTHRRLGRRQGETHAAMSIPDGRTEHRAPGLVGWNQSCIKHFPRLLAFPWLFSRLSLATSTHLLPASMSLFFSFLAATSRRGVFRDSPIRQGKGIGECLSVSRHGRRANGRSCPSFTFTDPHGFWCCQQTSFPLSHPGTHVSTPFSYRPPDSRRQARVVSRVRLSRSERQSQTPADTPRPAARNFGLRVLVSSPGRPCATLRDTGPSTGLAIVPYCITVYCGGVWLTGMRYSRGWGVWRGVDW